MKCVVDRSPVDGIELFVREDVFRLVVVPGKLVMRPMSYQVMRIWIYCWFSLEGKGTLGKVDPILLPDEFRVVGLTKHG